MKGIPELIAAIAAEDREMAHAVAPTLLKLDKDVSKWNEGRPGKKNLSVTEILAGAMGKMGRGGDTALEFVNPQEQELLKMAGSQRSTHPLLGVTENYYGSYGDEPGGGDDPGGDGNSSSFVDDGPVDTGPDDETLGSPWDDPDDLSTNGFENFRDMLGDNLRPGKAVESLFGIKSRGGRQGAGVGQAVGGLLGSAVLGGLGSLYSNLQDRGVDIDFTFPEGPQDDGNSDNNKPGKTKLAQTPLSLPDAIEMPQGLNLTGTPLQQRAQLATLALYGGQGQGVARSKAGQDFYRNLAARTLTGDNERLPVDIQYMRDILGETV